MPILYSMGSVEAFAIMAYMGFVEAQVLPLTSEHQPFLAVTHLRTDADTKKKQAHSQLGSGVTYIAAPGITKLRDDAAFKITSASRVRGSATHWYATIT
jgi:membrane protein YqaA with SNARE-associated domain